MPVISVLCGRALTPVRIRPLLNIDLTSEDGRIDWVVVDAVLRGEFVEQITGEELDAVLDHLVDLRIRFHGDHSAKSSVFNDRSPYRETLESVAHALGETLAEFNARITRYQDKINARRRRERRYEEAETDG
jgi:hypothetical protein